MRASLSPVGTTAKQIRVISYEVALINLPKITNKSPLVTGGKK